MALVLQLVMSSLLKVFTVSSKVLNTIGRCVQVEFVQILIYTYTQTHTQTPAFQWCSRFTVALLCLCVGNPGMTGSGDNHILVIVIIISVGAFTIIVVVVGAFLCTRRTTSHQKK